MKLEYKNNRLRRVRLTQDELDTLRDAGFTHLVAPDPTTPDKLAFSELPAWVIGDEFYPDLRPVDLTTVPEDFRAVLPDGVDLPDYDQDGFLPSYVLAPGHLFRADGSEVTATEAQQTERAEYACPFCGRADCSGSCVE